MKNQNPNQNQKKFLLISPVFYSMALTIFMLVWTLDIMAQSQQKKLDKSIVYENFEGAADLQSKGWVLVSGSLPVSSTASPGEGSQSLLIEKKSSINKIFDLTQDAVVEWKIKAQNEMSSIYINLYEGAANNTGVVRLNLYKQTLRGYSTTSPSPYIRIAKVPSGEWTTFRVELTGNKYNVYMNGEQVGTEYLTMEDGVRQKISRINFANMSDNDPIYIDDIKITVK